MTFYSLTTRVRYGLENTFVLFGSSRTTLNIPITVTPA